jgi:hypothetical protein
MQGFKRNLIRLLSIKAKPTARISIPIPPKVDEEIYSNYLAARYYPVRITQVLKEQYLVGAKLGYGGHLTVWLSQSILSVLVILCLSGV